MNLDLTMLVDKLVGRYTCCGSSEEDEEAFRNLDEISRLLDHVFTMLRFNVLDGKQSTAYSIQRVANKSQEILDSLTENILDLYCDCNK